MKNLNSQAQFTVKILALLFLLFPFLGSCRRIKSTPLTCLPESRQLYSQRLKT
ncbi:MAG: hypothetical protein AAF063_18185 [Cyanobacteria bacterium J06643_5]